MACLIGGSAYAAAFVALSVFTSRALLLGLGYTLIWEGVLSGLLEGTKFLSIRQATLGIAAALGAKVPGTPLTLQVSVLVVAVVIIGAFVLGTVEARKVRDPRRRLIRPHLHLAFDRRSAGERDAASRSSLTPRLRQ